MNLWNVILFKVGTSASILMYILHFFTQILYDFCIKNLNLKKMKEIKKYKEENFELKLRLYFEFEKVKSLETNQENSKAISQAEEVIFIDEKIVNTEVKIVKKNLQSKIIISLLIIILLSEILFILFNDSNKFESFESFFNLNNRFFFVII